MEEVRVSEDGLIETFTKKWYKSKVILLQIVQGASIYMQTNGEIVLQQINENLTQFEVYLPSSIFQAISIACIIATMYYRFKPMTQITK